MLLLLLTAVPTPPTLDWEAVSKHGFGVVVAAVLMMTFIGWCGAMGYFAARACRWFANKVIIPLRDRHIEFLDSTNTNLGKQTEILGTMAERQARQHIELKQVIEQHSCQVRHGCVNYTPNENGVDSPRKPLPPPGKES